MDIGDRSPPSQAGDDHWVEVREVQGGKHTVESVLGGRGEAGTRGRGGQREPERSRRRQRQPSPPEYPPCQTVTTWASPGQGTSVLCHHPGGRWSP